MSPVKNIQDGWGWVREWLRLRGGVCVGGIISLAYGPKGHNPALETAQAVFLMYSMMW